MDFLCPSELEESDIFIQAADIMWQQIPEALGTPSDETVGLVKAVLKNELAYIQSGDAPDSEDIRLFQELIDENIDRRGVPEWVEQISRRLKAVAWRYRVQEHFFKAALLLAEEGLIEPDFKVALEEPINVSGYRIHPRVQDVKTALRGFGKAWRLLVTPPFKAEGELRRHLASPFPCPFYWLAAIVARSATTTELSPIIKLLKDSKLLGPFEELSPPLPPRPSRREIAIARWNQFASGSIAPLPCIPATRNKPLNNPHLIETVLKPQTKIVVDPKAGAFQSIDRRSKGGTRRQPALAFWLPAAGMGKLNMVISARKYQHRLWERITMVKIAYEAWFGDGKWGPDHEIEDLVTRFVDRIKSTCGDVDDGGSAIYDDQSTLTGGSRAARHDEGDQVDDESGIIPFPDFVNEDGPQFD